MNQNFKQKICHANVDVNLMVESVIQIESGIIIINVGVSIKTSYI